MYLEVHVYRQMYVHECTYGFNHYMYIIVQGTGSSCFKPATCTCTMYMYNVCAGTMESVMFYCLAIGLGAATCREKHTHCMYPAELCMGGTIIIIKQGRAGEQLGNIWLHGRVKV